TASIRDHNSPVAPGRCVHGDLRDGEIVIDDVLVVPGDGFADISTHGGPWVVHCVTDLARRSGFEPSADPLDGADGDTIIEREIAAALPLAKTELGIEALLAQREAWSHITPDDLPRMLADDSLLHLLHPRRVAIIGAPNVGKSTLANQLFAQERSITADLPGTTRDWVGELANIDGLPVVLVDTPGLRQSDDPIEQQAIQRSRPVIAAAALVVLVLDPTQDRAAQDLLAAAYPAAMRVLNKSDRPAIWQWDDRAQNGHAPLSWHGLPARVPRSSAASARPLPPGELLESRPLLPLPPGEGRGEGLLPGDTTTPVTTPLRIVATTGAGVDQLRHAIQRHFGCHACDTNLPRCWTDRQRAEIRSRIGRG
ncbi:MAG: GTPase, partial [Tepidisphaerales bacterium]